MGMAALVVGLGIGSVIFGKLGDSMPRGRLMEIGTAALALALATGTFLRNPLYLVITLLIGGLGAAATVTVGYAYFAELMGEEQQGEYTGIWAFSLGFGRIASPMVVGLAIDFGKSFEPKVKGYPMMWAASGLLAVIGWFLLWKAVHSAHERTAGGERAAR